MSDLLLPPGTRLVHIGPHKTGSTALQGALHLARDAMESYGARYAATGEHAHRAARALVGGSTVRFGPPPEPAVWDEFAREVGEAGDRRVIMSAEAFDAASPEQIAKLRDDLGPDRVHILRMVRRYDRILPSWWQEHVKSSIGGQPWPEFVERILAADDNWFWRRSSYAAATKVWADVVGPERVTVVIVDETDRDWLFRVTERLLGLPAGLLVPNPEAANPSLSRADAEMTAGVNRVIHARKWNRQAHTKYVWSGIVTALGRAASDPAGGRILLSDKHARLVSELAEAHIADLRGMGVNVVGDLDWLEVQPSAGATADDPALTVAVERVVAAAGGILRMHRHGEPLELTKSDRRRDRALAPDASKKSPSEAELEFFRQLAVGRQWPMWRWKRFLVDGAAPWLGVKLPSLAKLRALPAPATEQRMDTESATALLAGMIAQSDPRFDDESQSFLKRT